MRDPTSLLLDKTLQRASSVTLGHSTPPISHLHKDDDDTVFGGDEEYFATFPFSSFTVQADSHTKAPVTQGQLKEIKEKLNSLLEASKASYSEVYSKAAVKFIFQAITKKHNVNHKKLNKAVTGSAVMCKDSTEKVDKLINDAQTFILKFQTSFKTNISKANAIIANLGSSLKTEKEALEKVRTGLQKDKSNFQATISSQIEKLHVKLAM
ncbi:unnamed protein product [Lactuca saligna]|uniref:Uncharacterized protein n=1 Tax=Lactuca saligna TaxID=75948 RepID=A0AA35Z903_LACSI|nr:unnamed protein product [Lactuca saligna]